VTDYAHGNLKFIHFQCITFADWSPNNLKAVLFALLTTLEKIW